MERTHAVWLLDRLHTAQNEFYSGGRDQGLRPLLAPQVSWFVPGRNSISGEYYGVEGVLEYFRRRRDLAGGTLRLSRRDVLVGDGVHIAALTDGAATIDGQERRWSTIGLYGVEENEITACWLLPLDPTAFDSIWTV